MARAHESAAGRTGLGRAVASGLAWKGASQVTTQVMRFGIALVLARLLSPHDYGIAGMVLIFMSFVLLFSDFALGHTIVQRAELTQVETSTAFWISLAAGTTFTLVGVAAAGPVSSFFHQPVLRPMLEILSLTFVVQAVGTTQSALLVREMAFRSLETRHMAATLAGGAVAIAVAARGYGAWAIVAQQLAIAVASTVLVWRFSSWRPGRHLSAAALRSFAGFTGNVFGTSLLSQLRDTSDNLLVGRFLGATPLGAYALAYNLVLVPFNRVAVPLAQVLFPALSRVQDDPDRIGHYWLRSLRLMAAVAAPCCVGLVVVGPDFVHVVLGDKWNRAIPVIQLLAVVGLLQTLQFLSPIILQAVNRTTTLLRWTLASYGASMLAFVIGLHWGIVGVASAYAISSALVEPLFAYATARTIDCPFRGVLRALRGAILASALMAVLLVAARLWAVHAGLAPSVRLVALACLGALAFAAGLRWLAPDLLGDIRSLRGRPAEAAADTHRDSPLPEAPAA